MLTTSLLSTGIRMDVWPVFSSFSTRVSTKRAVDSGDFKTSAKPERNEMPCDTKSFGCVAGPEVEPAGEPLP